MIDLDKFLAFYIEAALWSSTDDNDVPLDANYDDSKIAVETLKAMRADCERFIRENAANLGIFRHPEYTREQIGGHDFWLTRNHHGSGFWDGDWPEPEATALTEAAEQFGEKNLYVGDDGLIYQE